MKFKAVLAVILIALMAGVMAFKASPAKAQAFNNNNLNDLIVMNGLFTGYSAQNLAGLIAVDNVTGGGTMASTNNLNDLIVMNGLFTGYSAQNLAGLIAVDNVTSGGGVATGGSFTGNTNLSDLIVLGGLFGNGWGWNNNAAGLAGLIAVNNMHF